METCFNYCDTDRAYFSSDERRWVNRIYKLAQDHPEEVRIIKEPEDNDGCIYCELPVRYLRVVPPVKRVLTEEQKQEGAERLRRYRENIRMNQ